MSEPEEQIPDLGLPELLAQLGADLRQANRRAHRISQASLYWAEASVEVQLAVTATTKEGVKFSVMGLGAEGSRDQVSGRTVRVNVLCKPLDPDSQPVVGE